MNKLNGRVLRDAAVRFVIYLAPSPCHDSRNEDVNVFRGSRGML